MPSNTCTATYAVSRPCAGESSASSPAEKRSSIGNETGWRARISRHARTASAARARGSAYSISSKRTSRGLAKTSKDSATRSRFEAARPATRLMAGIAARRAPRGAIEQPEGVVVHRDVLQPLEPRPPRRARRLGAVVGARQRQRRVREGEQLEVVVGVDQAVEVGEHLLERPRLVDGVEAEGGHAAQGDGRDHSQRAEPDARGQQLVAALDGAHGAVGEHELHPGRRPSRGCRAARPSRASRWRARRRATARRCRRGSAARGRGRAAPAPGGAAGCPPRRARARSRGRRRARGPCARARAASRSVATPPENEWPAPATRTARPRATASASSALLPGRTCSAGAHVCPRDQFDHMLRGYRRMSWEPELDEPARGARARAGRRGAGRAAARHRSARGGRRPEGPRTPPVRLATVAP